MDEQHFSHEYRTGRTQPQGNKNALITGLLICVIFLAGLISAMGLLNIRLAHLLGGNAGGEAPPLSFSQDGVLPSVPTADAAPEDAVTLASMTLIALNPMYQEIYHLPAGLYIHAVQPGSPAAGAGIVPGDVLLAVDGTPVRTLDQVRAFLDRQPLVLTLLRGSQEFSVALEG